MPLPNTKQELADWMLRRLGAPVINVEISDVQLEDCIDEAVQWYQNWHYDGANRSYRTIKVSDLLLARNKRIHQDLTAERWDSDIDYRVGARVMRKIDNVQGDRIWIKHDSEASTFETQWKIEEQLLEDEDITITSTGQVGIKIPDSIISVVRVAKVDSFAQAGIYNYEYQYFLNNFDWFYGSGASGGLTGYYIQKTQVEHIDFMLNTAPAIRYNKHRNRLYMDIDWKRIERNNSRGDQYLLAEVYEVADPEIFGQVYQDMWLKRYSTALAKQQWGSNLKKYQNTELPGGVTLSGQELYDEARTEIEALEEELKNSQLEIDSILWG